MVLAGKTIRQQPAMACNSNYSDWQVIMKIGDNFTIPGFGIGAKGQLVIDGYNPKTRRKCKSVRQAVFTVTKEFCSGKGIINPPIVQKTCN